MSKDPFNPAERLAWDLISDTMMSIEAMDSRGRLRYNIEELCEAIHTLQHFVTQHMHYRLWPTEFSDWYAQPDEDPQL